MKYSYKLKFQNVYANATLFSSNILQDVIWEKE